MGRSRSRTTTNLRRAALALAVAAAAVVAAAAITAFSTLPRLDGEARLPGLGAAVTIRRDGLGVPHITAAASADLWAAVGFVHAQDRFFQMEMTRRLAAGRLAEILGPEALDLDYRYRRLQMTRTAQEHLRALPAAVAGQLEAYARGVNAGLADTGRPIECLLLRYRPEPWTPIDTLLALKAMEDLLAGDGGEEQRDRLAAMVGPEVASYLFDLQGMAASTILSGDEEEPGTGAPPAPARPGKPLGPPWRRRAPEAMAGSNAWVVAGARTVSGKPLLANDTHLPPSIPAVFYQVHVVAPGLDVAGMTVAGAPFPVLGHNGRVAWGMTALMADQVDYVRLDLVPDDPFAYRVGGEIRHLERRDETIAVRGQAARTLTVRVSPWGPVVSEHAGTAIARDWVADRAAGTMVAIGALAQTANVAAVVAVAADFTTPGLSLLAADRDGGIAYQAAAALPARRSGDGTRVLDAADAGWQGFLAASDAVQAIDPRRGYLVSANNEVGRSPRARRISASFAPPFRADRISRRIEALARHDVASFAAIQKDAVSEHALRLLRVLPAGELDDPRADRWWRRLKSWDGSYVSGPEPAVFEAFAEELRRAVLEDEAGAAWTYGTLGLLKASQAYAFTEVPPELAGRDWFDDVRTAVHEGRRDRIERALIDALADLEDRLGRRESSWRWERVHTLRFTHPLVGVPLLGRWFSPPRFSLPGSRDTVNANAGRVERRFAIHWIPSFRMILDLGDFRRSRIVNSTGQSGNPLSRHYHDQTERWAAGASYPLIYDEADVAAATRHSLTLLP